MKLIKHIINIKTSDDLAKAKRKMSKEHKISFPSNVSLLKAYHKLLKKKRIKENKTLENLLRKHPIRSLSGVVIVSVLTKPYPCPGKCIFCPTEKDIPKSYLSGEPAVERAKLFNYDPYLQMKKRIEALEKQGHPTDKVELRIIGGSWSVYPKNYKTWFVANCFRAANRRSPLKKSTLKQLEKEQKKK